MASWTDALRRFIDQADAAGILVMCNGVIDDNTHRRLDPDELRGFALVDDLAPLVFVNGADTKAVQMFTLAHELAHVWIGESGVSDSDPVRLPNQRVERWCNQVAAGFLVPLASLKEELRVSQDLRREMKRLASRYKVSTLVMLRRMYDAGAMKGTRFRQEYARESAVLRAARKGSGGNFYLTLPTRVSQRFARALVVSTLEGHTLHRDAFRMLGFRKHATFEQLGRTLGVA